MNKAALVILNYNGAGMLRDFLPLVIKNTPEAKIYVADNASSDNSVALLRESFPNVTLLALDRN